MKRRVSWSSSHTSKHSLKFQGYGYPVVRGRLKDALGDVDSIPEVLAGQANRRVNLYPL
jgi:hypothetical protein